MATETVKPPPIQWNLGIYLQDSRVFWGVNYLIPTFNPTAGILILAGSQLNGGLYSQTMNMQPIVVIASASSRFNGATLYYDPVSAAYDPSGGNNEVSFIGAVLPGDPNIQSTLPLDCEFDANNQATCFWDAATRVAGVWYLCGGLITLTKPGISIGTYCSNPKPVSYVSFVAPVPRLAPSYI